MNTKSTMGALLLLALGGGAVAQVNTVVTDGKIQFAEGILDGYIVQADGLAICSNPYVIGRYISCLPSVTDNGMTWKISNPGPVYVETNGVLGAMIVVGPQGQRYCTDPLVWNQFRGPTSYIVCE